MIFFIKWNYLFKFIFNICVLCFYFKLKYIKKFYYYLYHWELGKFRLLGIFRLSIGIEENPACCGEIPPLCGFGKFCYFIIWLFVNRFSAGPHFRPHSQSPLLAHLNMAQIRVGPLCPPRSDHRPPVTDNDQPGVGGSTVTHFGPY
jgi:hypothetical protein